MYTYIYIYIYISIICYMLGLILITDTYVFSKTNHICHVNTNATLAFMCHLSFRVNLSSQVIMLCQESSRVGLN